MIYESQIYNIVKISDGEDGIGTPGKDGQTLYTWIVYADDDIGANLSNTYSGQPYMGVAYNKTTDIESTNANDYTFLKIIGKNGEDGVSPYQVILDNENITFSTDTSGTPLSEQSFVCNITAFKGITPTSFSIGIITTDVNGITVSKSTDSVALSVSPSTVINAHNGSVIIPIAIENTIISKVITWSCAQSGKDGENGISVSTVDIMYYLSTSPTELTGGSWNTTSPEWENGKYIWSKTVTALNNNTTTESEPVCITGNTGTGIESITEMYYLGTSKAECPAPPADWTVIPPAWSPGKYIWTCSRIIYKNPASTEYTTPVCDSSWESANEVQDNLNNAITEITSAISGVESKVEKNTKSIIDKVWQTDITERVNAYDETTGQAIRNRVTQTEADINGITSAVSDMQLDIANKADGSIVTTVSNRVTELEANLDGFKSTVSDTYITKTDVNNAVDNLQQQIDGAIETFTGAAVPSLSNIPASDWTTDAMKDKHIGDLYIVNSEGGDNAGFYYRFDKNSTGTYSWVLLKDNEITKALQDAADAMAKANSVGDDLRTNYSTTAQMSSAISQTKEEIELSVSSQITEVNDSVDSVDMRVSTAETALQLLADSISMLVTDANGSSLMTQTDTGWTFNIENLQSTLDDASANLDTLEREMGDVNSTVDVLQKAVADLEATSDYVRITVYENEPCIELGESDSDFKVLITNTRIMFREGSNVPTHVSNDGLITDTITVENELRQKAGTGLVKGEFVWKARPNGNYGLQWKGGNA